MAAFDDLWVALGRRVSALVVEAESMLWVEVAVSPWSLGQSWMLEARNVGTRASVYPGSHGLRRKVGLVLDKGLSSSSKGQRQHIWVIRTMGMNQERGWYDWRQRQRQGLTWERGGLLRAGSRKFQGLIRRPCYCEVEVC